MEYYAELCSEDVLDDIILPETLIGLHEEDDLLVAATLKGLGVLVTLLGAEVVMGTQRKNVFSDSRPALTAPGLGRVKTSGSVSTEGSGLLRAPDKPLPLPRQEAGADMTAPGMSKEERRQLRREEQERRRQQRLAQKAEKEGGMQPVQNCMRYSNRISQWMHCVVLFVTLSKFTQYTDIRKETFVAR